MPEDSGYTYQAVNGVYHVFAKGKDTPLHEVPGSMEDYFKDLRAVMTVTEHGSVVLGEAGLFDSDILHLILVVLLDPPRLFVFVDYCS